MAKRPNPHLSCTCGKTFGSYTKEAYHRHNFPIFCKPVKVKGELLCYSAQEPHEGTGGFLFATSDIEARRLGANLYNDGEITGMTVNRQAWADKYAPGPVPKTEILKNSTWYFECSWCYAMISECADDYDQMNPVDGPNGDLYCCPEHANNFTLYAAFRKQARVRAQQIVDARLRRKYPWLLTCGQGLVSVEMSLNKRIRSITMYYTMPESKFGSVMAYLEHGEKTRFHIPSGDMEAWTTHINNIGKQNVEHQSSAQ